MSSAELIIEIASKMHLASLSFIVAALLTLVVYIYSIVARRGNSTGLKEIISSCVWYALLFWILAWLIL